MNDVYFNLFDYKRYRKPKMNYIITIFPNHLEIDTDYKNMAH